MSLSCQNINRVAVVVFLFLNLSGSADIINPFDRGNYSATGVHSTSSLSYEIGSSSADHDFIKNHFMVFDLSGISQTVIGAELQIYSPAYGSTDPLETYEIYDISTDIDSILDGTAGVVGFNDMQSGNLYGSADVSLADNATTLSITLNAQAVLDISNSLGGEFAFGGTVSTLDYLTPRREEIFVGTSSGNPADGVALVLTIIPEPSVLGLLLLGCGMLALRRRRMR